MAHTILHCEAFRGLRGRLSRYPNCAEILEDMLRDEEVWRQNEELINQILHGKESMLRLRERGSARVTMNTEQVEQEDATVEGH